MEDKTIVKPMTENKESLQFSENPAPIFEKKRKVMHKWTDEEDQALCLLVSKKGSTQWSAIAKSIPGRSGKQCRERWYNHLNPAISHLPWTDEEDELLREYQRKMGNQWTKIAEKLSGRSENEVKNRANSLIRKAKTMNKRFQKSMSKLIPPASHGMVNGVNVVDGSLVRPPYYPSLVPSSGYAYKPVVYPYDPSKTIPATNSVQSATPANQSLGVKRDEVPPVYYPYGYTVPVDKAQPYEVLPNYGYSVASQNPYEYPVVPAPGYVPYPGQTFVPIPHPAGTAATQTAPAQPQLGLPYALAPYPAYQQVYAVNGAGNMVPNQYLGKRYPENAQYYLLHPEAAPKASQGEDLKANVESAKQAAPQVKTEAAKAVEAAAPAGTAATSSSNYDSSSDSNDNEGKENYNQTKIEILQQVCHQIMEKQ